MKSAVHHLRANAVAYLALFVALGGTSYAAANLPAGSVGTRALRNGAVTANKLGRGAVTPRKLGAPIAGYVAYWAQIGQDGRVLAASAPTTTSGWTSIAEGGGQIFFKGTTSQRCTATATISGEGPGGYVSISNGGPNGGRTELGLTMRSVVSITTAAGIVSVGAPEPVNVVVICP